jgi:hypothetical protein
MNVTNTTEEELPGEELPDDRYYPDSIRFEGEVAGTVASLVLCKEFARLLGEAGLGKTVGYAVTGMRETTTGLQTELEEQIERMGTEEVHHFAMLLEDQTRFNLTRGVGGRPSWSIEGRYPAETLPNAKWMEAMAKLSIASVQLPGFDFAVLARHETSWAEFPPMPPLARYNHAVTTSEAEVADSYEDPSSFWKCWDRVERVGDQCVCIRGLESFDVESWLGWTFESTMHLARIAKPSRTIYRTPREVHPAIAPWWEYGDIIADEAAGYPALSLVGYDASTRTVEYSGYCTDTDIAKGGTDPRHVLIREIHEIRSLVKSKKDRDGHPVDTVRVVFAEEWMARRERRPLLDVGARVCFMDPKTGKDIEVTD